MKTEITHKLIGITALMLTASFISTAVQAATVTIDSLTYETNEEDSTASVTDCPDNFTGAVTIPSSITVDGTAYTVTDIRGWNRLYRHRHRMECFLRLQLAEGNYPPRFTLLYRMVCLLLLYFSDGDCYPRFGHLYRKKCFLRLFLAELDLFPIADSAGSWIFSILRLSIEYDHLLSAGSRSQLAY